MFEDLVETVVGPWGIAAVLLLGTSGGRRMLRGAFKEAVKAGMVVSEKAQEVAADLKENASDMMAEAKAERTSKAS